METLTERLERLRRERGLSGREISRRAGLGQSAWSDVVNHPERSPQLSTIRSFARVLGVSLGYLAEGLTARERASGFAESEVQQWTPRLPPGERPDILMPDRLARALAPDAGNPQAMISQTNMPEFGILQGDVLVLDMKRRQAAQGDLVVINAVDLETGSASTLIRRYLQPYAIDPGARKVLLVDGASVQIMGVVVASFRAPQLIAAAAGRPAEQGPAVEDD